MLEVGLCIQYRGLFCQNCQIWFPQRCCQSMGSHYSRGIMRDWSDKRGFTLRIALRSSSLVKGYLSVMTKQTAKEAVSKENDSKWVYHWWCWIFRGRSVREQDWCGQKYRQGPRICRIGSFQWWFAWCACRRSRRYVLNLNYCNLIIFGVFNLTWWIDCTK